MTRLRSIRPVLATLVALGMAAGSAGAQQTEQADVLSIGGSVTEIVMALGQGHRLKARDSTSTYPPAVADLPDVGYMRALSPEGVLSVGPALILSEEGAGPVEAVEVIRAADVDFVEVPDAYDASGIMNKITIVGAALGVPDRAAKLADTVGADLRTAATLAESWTGARKRVLFVLSTQGGKITASGTGTAADAIIRLAGGVNAVTDFTGYRQLSDESLGLAAPDLILMMDRSGDHAATVDDLFAMPAMQLTPAADSQALVRMDGLLMLGFGPRTAQAVTRLNHALYGERS